MVIGVSHLINHVSRLIFSFAFQFLNDQLAQCKEEAVAKVNELQVKLIELEYNVRKEVSQEFAEQLTEIEDKHT